MFSIWQIVLRTHNFIYFCFFKIKNKPKKFLSIDQLKIDENRAIADYISGMTDIFLKREFKDDGT